MQADVFIKVFIGDYHQLPSVAPGNVLKDFIESQLKVIELDEIYRQSKIQNCAMHIN